MFLAHIPVTNTMFLFLAAPESSCASVKISQGVFRIRHREAADENGGNDLLTSVCVVRREPLVSLKETNRLCGAINRNAGRPYILWRQLTTRAFEKIKKFPLSLLISSPPYTLQKAMYCDKWLSLFLASSIHSLLFIQ